MLCLVNEVMRAAPLAEADADRVCVPVEVLGGQNKQQKVFETNSCKTIESSLLRWTVRLGFYERNMWFEMTCTQRGGLSTTTETKCLP